MRLLVALDEYRNVKRVAAYMNVTQPAVSKTLAGLESGIGIKLFHRSSRGMEPTVLGASLIRHSREILLQLHDAQTELREMSEGRISRITIGALPTSSVVIIPRFIARMESVASSTIRVAEGTMDRLLPMLRAGDADFVFGLLPHAPMQAEFGTELMIEDPIVVAARRAHPLVRVQKLSWDDVAQFPMILPPPTATTRFPIESLMSHQKVTMKAHRVETVSTMAIIGAMQYSDSVGFVSSTVARQFSDLGTISILPIPVPNVTLKQGLIYLSDKPHGDTHQLVLDIFREVCARLKAQTDELLPKLN